MPLVVVGGRGAVGPSRPGGEVFVGDLGDVVARVRLLEHDEHPRWLVPDAAASIGPLVAARVDVQRCWDVAEVHRILRGGWAADLGRAWASAHGLDPATAPAPRGDDLFDLIDPLDPLDPLQPLDIPDTFHPDSGSTDSLVHPDGLVHPDSAYLPDRRHPPRAGGHTSASDGEQSSNLGTAAAPGPDAVVRPDGHLRADALDPTWAHTDDRLRSLAGALLELGALQHAAAAALGERAVAAAHSESAAAVLCLELERDGLPVDRRVAEQLISAAAGDRPRDEAEAAAIRRRRDTAVLAHAPGREHTDLRNPVQVRELLASVGVTVPNTRARVLEPFRTAHPLVEALLRWRKDERIATTYGYRWLDEHVGPDSRLRGGWTACDGAAGRMTAQNGLHNLPLPLRPAVVAEEGHVFVRADLGQIEPRVLAVVSGDAAFAEATRADDLYAPVAAQLGVERPIAKIAVLAAMYGQRSGAAGRALGDLERAYPVAMRLLDDAYASGAARQPLRTFGGRRINLDAALAGGDDGARGRFARNAVIQGSAAELFKAWAATVRHVTAPMGARIVLCLHDELLVHAPEERADQVAEAVGRALADSARRWAGTDRVRFVADTTVIRRWSDAKA